MLYFMFVDFGTNIPYNIIECFSYLNLWLIILFLFIMMFFLLILSSSSLLCSKLCAESTFESWLLMVFILFVSFILFPLFDIIFDCESLIGSSFTFLIGSSFTLYSCGYQWSWLFTLQFHSVSINQSNINYYNSFIHFYYSILYYFNYINFISSNLNYYNFIFIKLSNICDQFNIDSRNLICLSYSILFNYDILFDYLLSFSPFALSLLYTFNF